MVLQTTVSANTTVEVAAHCTGGSLATQHLNVLQTASAAAAAAAAAATVCMHSHQPNTASGQKLETCCASRMHT
jgi:hypothetical protein